MLRIITLLLVVALAPIAANKAVAEESAQAETKIWRMVTYRIQPDAEEKFWYEFRVNAKALFDIGVERGYLTEYKVIKNPFPASPDDWDVMLLLGYENYAALDTFPENAAKAYLELFGSEEAARENNAGRDEWREVVSLKLVEAVNLD